MASLKIFRCQQYNIIHKTWNINSTSTRSAVNLAHDIYGPNPSESQKHIITLHGLLGSKRNWKQLSKKIAEATNACVISADARNHGDSPHENSHSYFDLAGDVSQLQQTLSITQSHIIGHSMGGRTGMVLALSEPTKVRSLIVVDISPIPRKQNPVNPTFVHLMDTMNSINFEGAENGPQARAIAMDVMVKAGYDKMTLAFLLMSIGERPNKTFGWKYNLDILKKFFSDIAEFPPELQGKQYLGETLFIGGGQSDYILKSDESAIRDFFPKAKLIYIEHVGHNAHSEDPAAFLNIVFDFYAKHL